MTICTFSPHNVNFNFICWVMYRWNTFQIFVRLLDRRKCFQEEIAKKKRKLKVPIFIIWHGKGTNPYLKEMQPVIWIWKLRIIHKIYSN